MSSRRSRATRFVTGLMASLAATGALAGCVPASSGAVVREPVRGCRDHVGIAGAADLSYSGEPSEYGNLTFWTSTDGSCSGREVPMSVAASTLIVADGSANAAFLCVSLLASVPLPGTFDDRTGPWSPPVGPAGFVCAG